MATWHFGGLVSTGDYTIGGFFVRQGEMQEQFESTWRKTRFGWEDSSKWTRPPTITFERPIELIHPLAFAGMILMSALGVTIWASEEWQTERLIKSAASSTKRKQRAAGSSIVSSDN